MRLTIVLDVLNKLWRLSGLEPARLKPVLRELDSITVFTSIKGQGRRTRHTFKRGEVRFKPVGVVTGKVNPHGLLQRQAAYH